MTMKCIAPEEIKEGDLMNYVEGTASQSVREHISRCPACAAQAEALAQMDRALRRRLFRSTCPSSDTLLGYVTGTLLPDERKYVARHLKECPHCAGEVEELKQAGVTSVSLLRQQIMRTARAIVEAVAVPPRPELALALRGKPYRLTLFSAGDLSIALGSEISGPGPVFRLRGRVMEDGVPAFHIAGNPVRLTRQSKVVDRKQVDGLGYFVFDRVSPGEYGLVLEHVDSDVMIKNIRLSSEWGRTR